MTRLLGIILVWLAFSVGGVAVAETQEELATTTKIARHGIGIGFSKGSLKSCETQNLLDGKEIECVLDPVNRNVTLQFYLRSGGVSIVGIEGTVAITAPIRVRFSSLNDHKKPFLQVPPKALVGMQMTISKFSVPGPFNAGLRKALGTLTIADQTQLKDSEADSFGSLWFTGTGLTLWGIRESLPGTEPSLPFSLAAVGPSTVRFDLHGRKAKIVDGRYESSALLSFARAQVLGAHGLQLGLGTQPHSALIGLTVNQGRTVASVMNLRSTANSVEYSGDIAVKATSVKDARIGGIAAEVNQDDSGLVMSAKSVKLTRLVVPGNVSISSSNADPAFLVGIGRVTLDELSVSGMKGTFELGTVSQYPRFGNDLKLKPETVTAVFEQTAGKATVVEGVSRVSALSIGTITMSNFVTSVKFGTVADGSLGFSVPKTVSRTARIVDRLVEATVPAKTMIEGPATIDRIRGSILNMGSAQRQLRIAKDDFQFRFDNPAVSASLAGGPVNVPGKALSFSNTDLIASATDGLKGGFNSIPTVMTSQALNVVNTPGGPKIRIGDAIVSASDAFFTVDPRLAAESPFGLTGSFIVKQISARFDPPTQLRANDIELRTSEVSIEKLTISANLVKARVSIEGFKLTADEFKMVKQNDRDSPTLSGIMSSPFSISLAEVDIPYTAPVDLFNLNVRNVQLALRDVKYIDAAKSTLTIPSTTFHVTELSDEKIVAAFEATNGTYDAILDSADTQGKLSSKLNLVRLSVDGPRKPMKGKLELGIGETKTSAITKWKALDAIKGFGDPVGANPNFFIPLDVAIVIPELSGVLLFNGDEVAGGLSTNQVASVTAHFLGDAHASWEHRWLLQKETRWRTEYPCGGTWTEPIRTCEAWGVLLPEINARLRWNFVLKAFYLNSGLTDFHIKPHRANKDVACPIDPVACPNGTIQTRVVVGVKQCRGHLVNVQPLLARSAFSLYPDLIESGGDVARLFNGAVGVLFGLGESAALAGLTDFANLLAPSFYIFGEPQAGDDCDMQ